MAHTLTLNLPDSVWDRVRGIAAERGESPESVVTAWLAQATTIEEKTPGRAWIGSWASNVPDAASRHDEYIGKSLHPEFGESNYG